MTYITLSTKQNKAVEAVERWFAKDTATRQSFQLFGFAGTGKTTIARAIADRIGGNVLFVAYTGKAAMRLKQVGCANSSTIHGLIYHYVGRHNSPTGFELNPNSEATRADLIIVDECSMIGTALARDLLSFGKPVLAIGDPGQLPPIGEAQGYFIGQGHDIKLTEIHRQAQDNPILQLATLARQGKRLPIGAFGTCQILDKTQSYHRHAAAYDQILTYSNEMRRYVNTRWRGEAGRQSAYPEIGERLICLRNNPGTGVFNGEQFMVLGVGEIDTRENRIDLVLQSLNLPERPILTVSVATECFTNPSSVDTGKRRGVHFFDYAYGITVHKAQGSEWDRVMIIDEPALKAKDRRQWYYTAITRARQTVMIAHRLPYMAW